MGRIGYNFTYVTPASVVVGVKRNSVITRIHVYVWLSEIIENQFKNLILRRREQTVAKKPFFGNLAWGIISVDGLNCEKFENFGYFFQINGC